MPSQRATWLSTPDAVLHLQRQHPRLGKLSEQIVEAAIRNPGVRKRARPGFEVRSREVEWRLLPDAEVDVYSGSVRYRGISIYHQIEVERGDLDGFAAQSYGLLSGEVSDKAGDANDDPRTGSPSDLARKITREILAGLDRKHLRHGWIAEIARRVRAKLNEHGHDYSESRVRDLIRPELQKWR